MLLFDLVPVLPTNASTHKSLYSCSAIFNPSPSFYPALSLIPISTINPSNNFVFFPFLVLHLSSIPVSQTHTCLHLTLILSTGQLLPSILPISHGKKKQPILYSPVKMPMIKFCTRAVPKLVSACSENTAFTYNATQMENHKTCKEQEGAIAEQS